MEQNQVAKIVQRALRNIGVWGNPESLQPLHAKAWRRTLEDPTQRIPKMFRGHMADALVQNSPFGFLYRQPNSVRNCFGGVFLRRGDAGL